MALRSLTSDDEQRTKSLEALLDEGNSDDSFSRFRWANESTVAHRGVLRLEAESDIQFAVGSRVRVHGELQILETDDE